MFKFVVLCAFLAAAAAEPGLLSTPLAYSTAGYAPLAYSGAIAPATTYISPASSIISPAVYSTPYSYPHFIKKRSAAFAYNGYIAPSTYYSTPLATTYTAPYVSSAAYLPSASIAYSTPAHFIKKRSAALAYSTYSAPIPTYLPTTYSAPLYTTPYISNPRLAYPTHYIKKRSVALAYAAPAAISHQSRVDYTGPVVSSYAAINPIYTPAITPSIHYV